MAGIDGRAIDGETDAAESEHLKAGGGDDDVGRDFFAGLRRMPSAVKVSISPVAMEARSGGNGLEQVGVGNEAEALVPGVVTRIEVRFDVVARGQVSGGSAFHEALGEVGRAASKLEDTETDEDVLPAHHAMGGVLG